MEEQVPPRVNQRRDWIESEDRSELIRHEVEREDNGREVEQQQEGYLYHWPKVAKEYVERCYQRSEPDE